MPLTSNSSSPIRIRPSVAAGPSGLIPTTNMLMRDLSLLPARLSPSPFLSFSSSIMCNSPGRSAYLCLIFSIKKKKGKKNLNRALESILARYWHFPIFDDASTKNCPFLRAKYLRSFKALYIGYS